MYLLGQGIASPFCPIAGLTGIISTLIGVHKMSKFVFVLLLLSSSAFADEWTTADSYREAAFQTLNVIDWGQTRYIAEHPDQFYEKDYSGLIGSNPTTGRIDAFMAEFAVLHFVASYFLPHGWRDAFQYITIGGKLNSTINNASIGIKMSF